MRRESRLSLITFTEHLNSPPTSVKDRRCLLCDLSSVAAKRMKLRRGRRSSARCVGRSFGSPKRSERCLAPSREVEEHFLNDTYYPFNCKRMSQGLTPIASQRPISWVLSATETSMMLMMSIPPTRREIPATTARKRVTVSVTLSTVWKTSR